jgi:hypothetical protein
VAAFLADAGADLIGVSAGGIHPDQQVPDAGPGYQVPYAERVGAVTGAAVGAVGGITDAEQADQVIRNGRADFALIGREHLRTPYFALEAAHELGVDVAWPKQYRRGRFEWPPAGAHAFAWPSPTSGMSSDPADRSRDRDRDEDLPELLDDLEATLSDLRSELRRESASDHRDAPARRRRRDRRGVGSERPRPPSVSELLGFTERYTIPTLIATLEATIRALELLRGTLRLVNPDGSAVEPASDRRTDSTAARLGSGAADVGRGAVSGVERALSELEAALAESNVPRDRASEELLGEIRDLSAEVRARLDDARGAGDADRGGRRGDTDRAGGRSSEGASDPDGVSIEVTDADDGSGVGGSSAGDARADEDAPEVDVEAELASIRREVRGGDGVAAADAGSDAGRPDRDGASEGDDAGGDAGSDDRADERDADADGDADTRP